MANITHFASRRCPVTHLTKLQVWALANTCIEFPRQMPNGVYRSLVIRGLLTSSHKLTADGREALASCTLLSDQRGEWLQISRGSEAQRSQVYRPARIVGRQFRECHTSPVHHASFLAVVGANC